MNTLRSLFLRLRNLFHKQALDRDLHDELATHLDLHIADNLRSGLSPAEARRQALLHLGGLEQTKESVRDQRTLPFLETLLQDTRFALRLLRKSPAFTSVAVLTLALGIGANAAIFSLISTILLRPLPIRHPEQVFAIHQGKQNDPAYSQSMSYPNYKDIRDRNQVLSAMAVYRFDPMSLSHNGNNERVWGYLVSVDYFDLLGVRPLLGRTFLPDEGTTPNAHPVVVLSHGCWLRRFGGDPTIVDSPVIINGRSFTIVGVAPPDFTGTESVFTPEFWVPSMMQEWIESGSGLESRGDGQWFAIGRLKSGLTAQQAQSQLNMVAQQLGREYPGTDQGMALRLTPPGLVDPNLRTAVIAFAGALMLTVALVLTIACTNLAGLLLARAAQRRKEIAVRMAIGATRFRLARQLLTESLMLSLIGAGLGLLLGAFLMRLARASLPSTDFALTLDLRMDWRVVGFVTSLSLLTGIGFGLVPAVYASRSDVVSTLKDDVLGGPRGKAWLRSVLVTMQVALSFVLLITAGLTVRSLQHTESLGPGFDPNNALTVSVDLGLQGYDQPRGQNFYRQLTQSVRALPGVKAVGLIRSLPLGLEASTTGVYPDGRPEPPAEEMPSAFYENISPGYFAAMGIPLLAGRDFAQGDTAKSSGVVIVNETLAQQFWPGENPIGKRLHSGNTGAGMLEVVGIAKNGKYQSLGELPALIIYYPISRVYATNAALVVRTDIDAASVISSVRGEVRKLDPNLPVYDARTLKEHMRLPLFPLHVGAVAVGSFGLLAMILAAVGIYGVMAYSVAQRTQEIGVRMALGARAFDVWKMVLRQGIVITAIGMVCGLLCAIGLSKVVASLLNGVSATDPLSFLFSSLLLAAVALVACFIPARRATKVDPVIAIKCL
jgi:macrolide transport system ATP-binding/permease protein